MPEVGSKWYPQTVKDRWHCASTYDQGKTLELVVGYRRANYSLRQIAYELTLRGLTPKRSGTYTRPYPRALLLAPDPQLPHEERSPALTAAAANQPNQKTR